MRKCKKCNQEIEEGIPGHKIGGAYIAFDDGSKTYCACWGCQLVFEEKDKDRFSYSYEHEENYCKGGNE